MVNKTHSLFGYVLLHNQIMSEWKQLVDNRKQ